MALPTGVDIAAHGLGEWPDVGYKIEQPPEAIIGLIDDQAAAGLQIQPTMRTIRNTQSMFDANFLKSPLLKHVLPEEYLAINLVEPKFPKRKTSSKLDNYELTLKPV